MSYIGVDEVGRGCLAGPMVVCAVVYDETFESIELLDSKKLSVSRREQITTSLFNNTNFAIGIVSAAEIDKLGISKAFEFALLQCYKNLSLRGFKLPYVIDGRYALSFEFEHRFEYKAEDKYKAVALASIFAKVYRDALMVKFAHVYPNYCFERHKGYGTLIHRKALDNFGYCQIHRRSFKLKS